MAPGEQAKPPAARLATDEAEILHRISGQLADIQGTLDNFANIVEKYGPAMEKAAALVDTPAAKIARGWRTLHG